MMIHIIISKHKTSKCIKFFQLFLSDIENLNMSRDAHLVIQRFLAHRIQQCSTMNYGKIVTCALASPSLTWIKTVKVPPVSVTSDRLFTELAQRP